MPPSYNCPKCSSENTQSFPMIYENGTTTAQSTSLAYNGEIGFIGGTTKTQSQTVLAQKVIPPEKPEISLAEALAGIVILMFIGAIVLALIGGGYGFIYPVGLALVISVAFGLTAYSRYQKVEKAKPVYEAKLANWKHSWMCLKCGNSFKHNPLKAR